MPWECLCRLIQAQWWWVFLFKRQPKQYSPLVQNHNTWVRESKDRQALMCFYCHCITSFQPNRMKSTFHSDLLSSDYVEIHYEGGKPVMSKVTSSLVLAKMLHVYIYTFFLSWGSLIPPAGTVCPAVSILYGHAHCQGSKKAQICFVSSSGNRLWNKRQGRLRVPVNQFACFLLLSGPLVIKSTLQLSCVIQTTAVTSRKSFFAGQEKEQNVQEEEWVIDR